MYYWDEVAKRYRDERGRFVSRAKVLDYVGRSIDSTTSAMDAIIDLVTSGNLSPTDFYKVMAEELKREYIRQYLLGIGGTTQMKPADWGRIGGMLAEQYKYLKGFANEIGDLAEGAIRNRIGMYFNSAIEAFERATAINARDWGAEEEIWVLGFVKTEHCPDCLAYSEEGYKPIGYYPVIGSGSTQCLTACRCHKEYRKANGEVYYG